MTTTEAATTELDGQIETFGETLFDAALGTAELTVAWLGRALGLYAGLRGETGLTAGGLASKVGIDERYAREWLEHQAVARVLSVDDAARPASERCYTLPEAHAIALLDEQHPGYVGALADIPPFIARTLELVRDAFRSGSGVPFASYGLHDMQSGFTRPMFATAFATEWLPALPDVHGRLEAGEPLRIADLGCGEGWAAIYLAEAYPNVTVDGYDLDDASLPPPGGTLPTAVSATGCGSRCETCASSAQAIATTSCSPARSSMASPIRSARWPPCAKPQRRMARCSSSTRRQRSRSSRAVIPSSGFSTASASCTACPSAATPNRRPRRAP